MIINSFGTIISHNPINRISIFLARVKNNYRKCIVFGMKILFETRRDETISFDLLENFSNVGRMDSFFFFKNQRWRGKLSLESFHSAKRIHALTLSEHNTG